MEELPAADSEMVIHAQEEFDRAFRTGTQDELDAARFQLTWALVHSSNKKHMDRGLQLAKQMLGEDASLVPTASASSASSATPSQPAQASSAAAKAQVREYQYLAAVAEYKLHKYIDARSHVKALLEVNPGFRQGEFLKGLVDDAIVKDGLIGVGVVGAVAGVALALLFSGSRK